MTPDQITAIATSAGVVIAVVAIFATWKSQREQTARNAYYKYLELAFQYPNFAYPDWDKFSLSSETITISSKLDDRKQAFERYEWFVAFILNTADAIFTTVKKDHVLYKLMGLQIAYHWKYFDKFKESKDYLKFWYSAHRENIDKAIALGKERSRRSKQK